MSDANFLYLNIAIGIALLAFTLLWARAELREQKRKHRKNMLESALKTAQEERRTER